MKKILYLILIIILCCSLCYGQNNNKKPAGPKPGYNSQMKPGGHKDNGILGYYFGISKADYDKLNLSQAQKNKVDAIKKKYAPQPPKPGQKPDFNKMKANREAEQKEFRALLTDSQKKQYDIALAIQKEKQKKVVSQLYTRLAKDLKFTADQNKKLNSMLNNYNGNPIEFNKKFESLLTKSQKAEYDKKKQNLMKPRKGPGNKGPGTPKNKKKK